jgi:hypothetical protein
LNPLIFLRAIELQKRPQAPEVHGDSHLARSF